MTMTFSPATEFATEFATRDYQIPAVDLYRDIHKGIRAELFTITGAAGNIDPSSRCDRAALADHVMSVAGVLESHAHHEDEFVDPVLQTHLPDLAEEINADHTRLEATFARVTDLAQSLVDTPAGGERRMAQLLHLDLARFTSAYLMHQDLEERTVMQELDRIIGAEACGQLHAAIVGSIPPAEMARSLAFMLPAMNLDDRAGMLGGMRMVAPPEAYSAVVGLARSVLQTADFSALTTRLDVTS